jgi:hypothetical protein
LVGVGEASFISLAAPFIDDNAPPLQVCTFLTNSIFIVVIKKQKHKKRLVFLFIL